MTYHLSCNDIARELVLLTLANSQQSVKTISTDYICAPRRGEYAQLWPGPRPNTLQEHMALMLRDWAGIEKASSHSGRRSLITHVIHKQKKSVKVAQKIAGHVNPSTPLIYKEPPEEMIEDALKEL